MAKKQENHKNFKVKETIRFFFSIIWDHKGTIYFLYFVEIILNLLRPLINTIVPKYIIDELMGEQNRKILIMLVLMIVVGNEICGFVLNLIVGMKAKCKDDLDRHFRILLSKKTMEMDYNYIENAEVLNKLEKAKQGMEYAGGSTALLDCIAAILTGILLVVESVAILLTGSPWVMVISFLAVLLQSFFTMKINGVQMCFFQKKAEFDRSFAYILWQLSNFRYGKDIRLYNAQEMMLDKADYYNGQLTLQEKAQANSTMKYLIESSASSLLQSSIIYLYLGVLVIRQKIQLGDFTMYISAGTNFASGIQNVLYNYQMIYSKCFYQNEFVAYMNYPSKLNTGQEHIKGKKEHIVEFRHVYFKYPDFDHYVLEDVSISIKPGECISVIGMNGAGKTTFIKLLCRLYDVNQGEILVDGINITQYDYKEYTKLFSVIFQDFKLFSFSIKENIVCGQEDAKIEDIEKEIKTVGLNEKIETLEHGIDTMIYKEFDETGVEPSGGEQQKLAIARVLYRKAPIIILDEPTAALDPIAEMEIYTQFNQLVGHNTAIYISHRLSSCKFCDRIIVFKNGKVIETGTHDELVQLPNGEYATMYETQAQYYKETALE